MVNGTPAAVVVEEPKLDRISLRTIPLAVSTFGPFEPSPGKGPAVSSGISSQSVVEAAELLDAARDEAAEVAAVSGSAVDANVADVAAATDPADDATDPADDADANDEEADPPVAVDPEGLVDACAVAAFPGEQPATVSRPAPTSNFSACRRASSVRTSNSKPRS